MKVSTGSIVRTTVSVMAALGTGASVPASWAQPASYPTHPLTLVVPAAAGGNLDVVARVYAAAIGDILKQTVVVENRGGASTNIGMAYVARAAPDGYTLLFAGIETTVNEFLYKLPFEPGKAFVPISLAVETPVYMVVRKDLPVSSTAELIAMAKAKPRQLTYASAGTGSPPHLSAEMFKSLGGVDIMHVPYKGAPQGLNDVIAGRIDVMFPSKSLAQPHAQAGNVKLLAVTSAKRLASEPDVPTVGEAIPDYAMRSWSGMMAPAGTPKEIVDTLAQASRTALSDRQVVERMQKIGLEIINAGPQEAARFMASEREKWGALVKSGQMQVTE